MARPHSVLFALQQLVIDLALIDRNHHLVGQKRSENDVEHSYSVALLCWFIHVHYSLNLDLGKILKYALIHDVTEIHTGDINTYASRADRMKKIKLEKIAISELAKEFKEFPDLVAAIKNYDAREDEESLFVWTVDKMQALILADMDGWRPYKKINISYSRFVKKHHEQLANCSPYCKQIFEVLLEYCKTTYYDQPKL